MKIDKIVFSCSEYFAPFWNLQAQIWKTKFNIDPVCLYFSDSKEGMSEEYGEVILCPFDDYLEEDSSDRTTDILQITLSKFFHPSTEPDTVWMIGDIDMFPLQTPYFKEGFERPKHGEYYHFNYTGIMQVLRDPNGPQIFQEKGSKTMGGYDLAGHYHIATGKTFKDCFFKNQTFKEVLEYVVKSNKYGTVALGDWSTASPIHKTYWCAEENYTSEKIAEGIQSGSLVFGYKVYDNYQQRIDRVRWNGETYAGFNEDFLKEGNYVDIHCHRPYHEQEESLISILKKASII